MLTGRESLIRLIGKRRRILPNRQSLLSTLVQSCLNLCTDANGKIVLLENVSDVEVSSSSDLVTCPVCRKEVRLINSHLDACLSRGTKLSGGNKRKMTQRTLLQLNFCSKSKVQIHYGESEDLDIDTEGSRGLSESLVEKGTQFDSVEEKSIEKTESSDSGSPLNIASVKQTSTNGLTEKPIMDDSINCNVDSPAFPPSNEMSEHDISVSMEKLSGVSLETFIVGRRFSDEKELNVGASICVLRDPDNVKDPNAIKVISADSGCCKVLGFLPRELAQYLSPLIDRYCLNFEGFVTSVPEHSLDVVPIQIVCQKLILNGEMRYNDIEDFRDLWKETLHAVESAKSCPPTISKYQKNFSLLLQDVLRNNHHLFADDEKILLESFTSLSDDSQKLFVRFYTRKGPWFRMSNITYPDVFDSQEAVKGLSAMGYVCSFDYENDMHNDDIKEILKMLTVSELREIIRMFIKVQSALSKFQKFYRPMPRHFSGCKKDIQLPDRHAQSWNGSRGTRKQDLIASLLSFYEGGTCPLLLNAILERTGACIRISAKVETLIWRAERLFFLNGEQDLSAFLLIDLGIVKYPIYNCIISDPVFSTRSDFLAYEEAIEVAQVMDQSLDENNIEWVLRCIMISDSRISSSSLKANPSPTYDSLATFLSHFSASWVCSKVILLGISFLEQERRYSDAVKLLKRLLVCFTCDGRRGYWTLRLSVDLEHMGHLNESLSVAEDGLLDSWVRAGSRMALQRRVLRLGKPPRRWKIPSFSESTKRKIKEVHILGRPLNCEMGTKSRFYGEDGEQCGVEELALQYYAGEGGGWKGVHTESGIWLTIFGLLMWDIVFADVPNVFRTRFQNAPLDLETDSFYVVRKNPLESHVQKIHDGMAEEILIKSWEAHVGTACRGVNWDRHSLLELRAAVTCIGGPCLASLCRHLAQDYKSWSSGMPDLLLWRFHDDYSGEAKLVEVKGPRDKLSEQQRAWLLLLLDCGFNAEVCKVSPTQFSD